jgi:hypothetical protein
MTKHKNGLYNSRINEWISINMDCTIAGSALTFIDLAIVQSMSMFCHSLIRLLYCPCLCFVIHWSGYCTVHVYALSFIDPAIVQSMFMLIHSLIRLLYSPCLCFVIHWSGYCTVHVYVLSFIDPAIVQSMFMFCYNSRINEWQNINMDCTIAGSMNDKT